LVVERINVSARGGGASVEALDHLGLALAARDRLVAQLGAQPSGLVDLAAAENAAVAGREGLRDRGRRPHDVDDDSQRGRCRLGRRERDVDAHGATLQVSVPDTDTKPARLRHGSVSRRPENGLPP